MPLSVSVPTVGVSNSTEAVKVTNTLTNLNTWANGAIATTDIGATLAQSAAVNQSGQTVKGATNISATESRTNVAYGTLTTPDQVSGITLASNGLIAIWFEGTWQQSAASAAKAAIFIGANQLQSNQGAAGPAVQEASIGSTTASDAPLATFFAGLASQAAVGYTGDLTTGQVVSASAGGGGPVYVFAAAGTYTVSVQFKASSGSVTAKNRKLWVQALSFA